jgi:transcriptional regulator with XRE-family HTH domain
MDNFNRNLRVAMAARNMAQKGLADAIGVSAAFTSAVCKGQKMPSSRRLVEIAKVLGVSHDYLLGGDDVGGQIDDVLAHRVVRKTARQLYEETQGAAREKEAGE